MTKFFSSDYIFPRLIFNPIFFNPDLFSPIRFTFGGQWDRGTWILINLRLKIEQLQIFKSNKQRSWTNSDTFIILIKLFKRIKWIGLTNLLKRIQLTHCLNDAIFNILYISCKFQRTSKTINKWISSFTHWDNEVIIWCQYVSAK